LGRIEIWTKADYEKIGGDEESIAVLAEKIMGHINNEKGE